MTDGAAVNAFTVIIPTFNRAEDLNRCLNSLQRQTYSNFKVIVCDDGSIDNSRQIVSQYEDKLNLSYFYRENWGGPARPRNIGIENTSTNWIFFLDSDDYFAENKIEYFAKMNLDDFDFFYHDLHIVKDGSVTGAIKSRQLKKDAYHDLLFNLNAIPTSSVLVRTDLLIKNGGFSEDKALVAVEDFDLWIRLCKSNCIRIKYIPIALGYYQLGGDNITTTDAKQIMRFNALYEPYINEEKHKNGVSKINGALNYQLGRIYALISDISNAKPHLVKALKTGSNLIKLKAAYQLVNLLKAKRK